MYVGVDWFGCEVVWEVVEIVDWLWWYVVGCEMWWGVMCVRWWDDGDACIDESANCGEVYIFLVLWCLLWVLLVMVLVIVVGKGWDFEDLLLLSMVMVEMLDLFRARARLVLSNASSSSRLGNFVFLIKEWWWELSGMVIMVLSLVWSLCLFVVVVFLVFWFFWYFCKFSSDSDLLRMMSSFSVFVLCYFLFVLVFFFVCDSLLILCVMVKCLFVVVKVFFVIGNGFNGLSRLRDFNSE